MDTAPGLSLGQGRDEAKAWAGVRVGCIWGLSWSYGWDGFGLEDGGQGRDCAEALRGQISLWAGI